jgi:hypothetical protein
MYSVLLKCCSNDLDIKADVMVSLPVLFPEYPGLHKDRSLSQVGDDKFNCG